ncbi:HlyD family efflux transporter periplasmic adaptor subunit [Panacagrimonas sp.]|uniref:HlyD family efflux transporter periplasmic adaptor subunit n=1 Tax=Panacagrimonas sp. TaxID=2480088 RepID=UPI003B52F4DF
MNLRQRLFARTQPLKLGAVARLIYLLTFAVLSFVAWSSWAELEEQIRARGKVIVSSSTQVVQVVDGGVLAKLHVRQGQRVKEGDLLAELQTTRFLASADEIAGRVATHEAAIERLEAELEGTDPKFPAKLQKEYPDIVRSQLRLYQRRVELQREELDAIARSADLAKQELAALEELEKTGDAARTEVIRVRREVSELLATAVNKRNAFRQEAQGELASSRSALEEASQQLTQRMEALDATQVRAPMSGTINNIEVTTTGGVLRPGDELLQIVPSDDPLIVEAEVSPVDVAFLRMDLPANIKLDAYDYTIYGSLRGKVTYISPDTVEEEYPQRDEEPKFRVHLVIDHIPERDGRPPIEVLPGMTATTEIITGKRTVAQYLLKPLRRGSAEALTER